MKKDLKPGIDYIGIVTPFYCNDGKGNFVLHQRSVSARDEQGTWDFGAGQLQFGEDITEGLFRELYEEYGVSGEIQEQVPAHSILREINGVLTHWVAIPFFMKVDTTKVAIMEPHKFSAIGIFTLDALPKPFHSGAAHSLKEYQSYFNKYRG